MGSKGHDDERRGSYAPDDDGHTSGSDGEYQKPVEVTFDPSSPYRRKSSLVSAEAPSMIPARHARRNTDCMVHQFLQAQKAHHDPRGQQAGSDHYQAHGAYDRPGQQPSTDLSGEKGLEEKVDVKGSEVEHKSRAHILGPGASGEDGDGQADEQAWRNEIIKSESQVNMAGAQKHAVDDSVYSKDELHSRLLTKKQLSDMAWGVRELSRRLSSMRIRFRVKTIFLLTKIHDADLIPRTRELVKWLLGRDHEVRYTVYVENKFRDSKKFNASGLLDELRSEYVEAGELGEDDSGESISKRLRYWDDEMCRTRPHTFDFIITLGGDGTVLYASWLFQRIVPPILSFALGSLGFLTKFDFEDHRSILTNAFNKGVTVSLRLRFEGTIMRSQKRISTNDAASSTSSLDDENVGRDLVEELIGEEKDNEHTHKPDGTYEILNEIVVDRGPNPTMSYTEIFGDDEHFTSVQADGICVSTPTGSTAYNLAAGGSLCHPENPVMLVTSICAHTLSFRPIILPDTIVLRVGVPYTVRTNSWASFDGRERVELHPGDYVTISASRYPFASVQAHGRRSEDWVNSISGKLGWNTRQKQKSYKQWN
ncbi:hypothetical protein VDGE_01453 [Verticillium dahliae]|uniref:ATP NAD kinase n=1 Tax=Verticillium dahliae TaxID=27337 RepID=A0A444RVB6_VERDA|nr:hypothetical protein VDGE_01453 [Verticillium dahliae]